MYDGIIKAITEMVEVDQAMRMKAEKDKGPWDEDIDIRNTARMKEIVFQIGWPSISKVGEEASHGAWLLVQHADMDLEFQKHCLELMGGLHEQEVARYDIAYLRDRILRNQNLPQIYGTQFILDKETGKYVPAPIEDPEHVEERRREMDLDTLVENTERINSR